MGEVFFWRGTPEQRAKRSLSGKLGRFSYFDQQLDYPDWEPKTVLDFGGNEGNLLLDRDCTIRRHRYYCLDVLQEALEVGRSRAPEAHWIHYNCYNRSFNPDGIPGLPVPDMVVRFDIILAYSVFTHTTREEMHRLVDQLRRLLTPNGVLAFTFLDPFYMHGQQRSQPSNLHWRLKQSARPESSASVDHLISLSRGAEWCSVIDGSELYVNSDGIWIDEPRVCRNYDVFYTADFIRQEFPGAVICPPCSGQKQHCCLIRA
ncbi:MAG TPA: class I SAM-dependent methyltransferase [Blastocatellia bacterium]